MPVSLRCPRCGKSASAPDSYVGQSVQCRQCRHHFTASPAPPAAAPAPQCVGRFQVRAELGSGAFGTVYRAYDPQLDREVALKVPRPGSLNTPNRVGRFLREGRTAARLCHPHIVPVFDAGQDGGHYYIASAFIEGRTLADAVGEGAFDCRRAAEVAHDLAAALAYAHGEGVVHRDVKPANVMLDTAGRPHLMDFGLARRQEGEEKLTRDGAVLGTPAYMAPEQAAEGADAGPASDQYSLGALLYELLCGEAPFAGPVDMVLYHAVHTEPAAPRARRPGVPLDLQTICLKAMAKRAEDRYPDCRALADDLRRWQEGEPIKARRPGLVERAARWCRREPALTAAAAAVVLCLAAVAGTATAMARHDAAARRDAEGLRQKAEDLAGSLQTANDDLRRESEQRIEAEVARRQAEWEKGRTVEAFEKYVAAMLAGHKALDERRYGDAVSQFEAAAAHVAGTNAAKVAEAMRRKALALQAAPPPPPPPAAGEGPKVVAGLLKSKELLKAGKYAEAEDAALSALGLGPKDPRPLRDLQRAIRQEWRQADDRQREQGAFAALMDDGKKYLGKKEYDGALKAFGAAVRRAPDARSADDADDSWKGARAEAGAESSKKLRDDLEKEWKAKSDLLVKAADSQAKAQSYQAVGLWGDVEYNYKQLGDFLAKQQADATTAALAAQLLDANARLLRKAQAERKKAVAEYEAAMAAGTKLYADGKALRDPVRLVQAISKFGEAAVRAPTITAAKDARDARSKGLDAMIAVLGRPGKPK